MPTPGVLNDGPPLWPEWSEEQRKQRIIGEVFGNVSIEYPEITREHVAQRLELRQKANVEIVPKK